MSNNLFIHKENDFSPKNISSIPLGNNIRINSQNNDFKKEQLNTNIKPMLSGRSSINIPEGK